MTIATPDSTTVGQKVATYYVVPVVPEDGSSEAVRYYEAAPQMDQWKRVSSKDLNARGQHCDGGKIKLLQPATELILSKTDLPASKLDQTVKLFAGVARTLVLSDDLQSLYSVGHDGSMTIHVTKDTVRGLILVFTKAPAVGMPPYPITQLIASTDPEIKNTTGGG